jgi:hypothetical protein
MGDTSSDQAALAELRHFVAPLRHGLADTRAMAGLLSRGGFPADEWLADLEPLRSALSALRAIIDALEEGDVPALEILEKLEGLADMIRTAPALAARFSPEVVTALPGAVLDTLVTTWLVRSYPRLFAALLLLGVIRVRAAGEDPVRPRTHAAVLWDRIPEALRDPWRAFLETLRWDRADESLDTQTLFHALDVALAGLVRRSAVRRLDREERTRFAADSDLGSLRSLRLWLWEGAYGTSRGDLALRGLPVPDPEGRQDLAAALELGLLVRGRSSFSRELAPRWRVSGEVDMEAGPIAVRFAPSGVAPVAAFPTGEAALSLGFGVAEGEPGALLFGTAAGGRVELRGLSLGVGVHATGGAVDISLRLAVPEKGLVIAPSLAGADRFISSLTGGDRLVFRGDLALGWSLAGGLQFSRAGLALQIGREITFGPVVLRNCVVGLQVGDDGFGGEATLDVGATLGPLVLQVDRIGMCVQIQPQRQKADAPVRGLRAAFRLVPPTGLGISIDAEAVKGGGFLRFEPDVGRYWGVLELVTPSFGLTALGILTTKIPGEPKGWSLFFALTATFNPGIQLGFGFVLTGVGGLFAVNRRLDEPAMQAAVRGGNLNGVLFPSDVVAEAPRIFATVESMFPIAKGSFVFGPMIKIGWGSPTLVEAMIGVFVSLPAPLIIALLGRVRLALPADKPILVLNMDIAGSINFGAGTVGLDAQIHDSTLFGLELTGGMAFRARFKDQPGFLLSVGGFHPAFEPPAAVGPLARMGMSLRLGKQENILVSLRSYFALTSNTLQFGAAIEVRAQVLAFRIYGGAYFNALIVYKPFHFTADMGAYFGVAWRKWELLAVRVEMTLDGPGPWRARGKASFTIIGLEKSFEFDETFGDKIAASEERAPVRAPLIAALADPGNWGAAPGGFDSLRLRDLPPASVDATHIVIAPGDRLVFRQRIAPLAVTLEQMGAVEPQERGPFAVRVVKFGARAPDPAAIVGVDELFAPAAYFDMTDAERLSAPSFEPMTAGVAVGAGWQAPAKKQRSTVVDGEFESIGGLWPDKINTAPDTQSEGFGALNRGDPDAWKRRREPVTVAPPRFVRASEDSLAANDEAQSWHAARARRALGERVLPAHTARKAGR